MTVLVLAKRQWGLLDRFGVFLRFDTASFVNDHFSDVELMEQIWQGTSHFVYGAGDVRVM